MRAEPVGAAPRATTGRLPSVYAIAAFPPLFWAGNFLIARLMRDAVPPVQLSFWRWALALLILIPFCWRPIAENWPRIRANLPFLALLGAIGVTAFNCFVYAALHHTTIVNAALVNSLLPVVTFLLAYLLLKERLTARQLAGIAVSLCGALLVICRGEPTQLLAFTPNRGDVLFFVGMSCWALYTVLVRRRPAGLPPMAFLGTTVFFGVLFHLPVVAWEHAAIGGFRPTAAGLAALGYLAAFPSILAYVCWNRSVAALGPGKTGMFMHLLPPCSALLGFFILGESIAWFHAASFGIIIIGIWLVTAAPAMPAAARGNRSP